MDNQRILLNVRSRRGNLHELHQVLRGTLLVVHTAFTHFIQHGYRVDDLRIAKHLIDRLVNIAVGLQIKVLRAHDAHHIADAAAVNEHGAEHGLLRLQRVRGLP